MFLLYRVRQRRCLCKTGPQKTRHLSWYVSTVFMFHNVHTSATLTQHWWIKHAILILVLCVLYSKATGPKKARTDQWGCPETPPSLLSFFHSLSFYQEDWPSSLLHLLILILISSCTVKSQSKTAVEAEQPYEAEMKVNLRDVSVDKTLPPPCSVGRTIFRATQT